MGHLQPTLDVAGEMEAGRFGAPFFPGGYDQSIFESFLIVTLTAMNVKLVARGLWWPMFASGTLLSWVWWENTKMANGGGRKQQVMYAMGAGCGTVLGAWIGGKL